MRAQLRAGLRSARGVRAVCSRTTAARAAADVVFGGIRMHCPRSCSMDGLLRGVGRRAVLRRRSRCGGGGISLELIDDRRAGQLRGRAGKRRVAAARRVGESAWAETTACSRREVGLERRPAGTAPARRRRGSAAAGGGVEGTVSLRARKRPSRIRRRRRRRCVGVRRRGGRRRRRGGAAAWADEAIAERTLKLYEDWLSELGLCRLCVRLREFEHGWEVRVRWWFCLNPGREPKRGVPHARLRESTTRLRYGAAALVRRTEERCLYFEPGGEEEEGAASLDADALRPRMPLVGDPTCEVLALDDGLGDGPTPAEAADGGADGGGGGVGGGGVRDARAERWLDLRARASSPGRAVVAAAAAGSGLLVVVSAAEGGARWPAARHAEVEQLAFLDVSAPALVLSCGADGCVRAGASPTAWAPRPR